MDLEKDESMRDLVDLHYPKSDRIRVNSDNLSIHSGRAVLLRGARRVLVG